MPRNQHLSDLLFYFKIQTGIVLFLSKQIRIFFNMNNIDCTTSSILMLSTCHFLLSDLIDSNFIRFLISCWNVISTGVLFRSEIALDLLILTLGWGNYKIIFSNPYMILWVVIFQVRFLFKWYRTNYGWLIYRLSCFIIYDVCQSYWLFLTLPVLRDHPSSVTSGLFLINIHNTL
jgi:hypothetical protein